MPEQPIVYVFEDLSDDLPRPPLSALRALLHSGVLPTPNGWRDLPVDVRVAIARHGTEGTIDTVAVGRLVEQIPPRYIKLISRARDPNPDHVPKEVLQALGPGRSLTHAEWRGLRAVDRSVLASLSINPRLLCRAYDELCPLMGKVVPSRRAQWTGELARCELQIEKDGLARLRDPEFLDGRALMLARVAGIRAARRIADVLDLHTESATGPVELDVTTLPDRTGLLWQAHVSAWDGSFFPAGSLLAVTTAAAATLDMMRTIAASARIGDACIREEAWVVGDQVAIDEEATAVYGIHKLLPDVDLKAAAAALEDTADRSKPEAEPLGFKTIRDLQPFAHAEEHPSSECASIDVLVADALHAVPDGGGATPLPAALNPPVRAVSGAVLPPASSRPGGAPPSSRAAPSSKAPLSSRRPAQPVSASNAPVPAALVVMLSISAIVFLAAMAVFTYAFLSH